jgi:glycosyltransferase involved in cell wall biosynthesis
MNKPTFAISSPYDTYSGYGARSRDIIKAIINTDKYDVKLLPQRWGGTSWDFCNDHPEWEFLHNYRLEGNLNSKPDIWMQITIPNEFQPLGKYNIGCTAGIEATLCKPEWIMGCNKMDMNWVSSKFSKEVLQKVSYEQRNKQTNLVEKVFKVEKPIEVVFEGVNLDIYKPLKANEITSINLDTIKESFCYLFVGHWMQGQFGHDRKNVGVLVKSFYETFKNKKSKPALILKASTGVNSYMSRDEILDKIKEIRSTVNSSNLPNIYVLNGSFNDKGMNELYNHPKIKAMVSLTKGEGYGRPLLEFSLTGKPIIASGWSGHTDFLNSFYTTLISGELENIHPSAVNDWLIKEAKWFKPNIVEFNQVLKDHYKKPKTYNEKARQQKNFSKTKFSYSEMEKLVSKLLEKNVPEFPKQVELKLPNLNLPQLQKIK